MNSKPSRLTPLFVAVGIALAMPIAAVAQAMPGSEPDHCDGPMRHHGGTEGHGMPHSAMPGMDMPGHMPGFGDRMPPFLAGLDLSEAQQDKIFAIMHAQAPLLRDQQKIMRKSNEQLRALALSAKYDDAAAKSLADASAKAVAETELLRARSGHQIYELLTPEQRTRADEMKARFEARRHGADDDRPGPRRQ